MAAAVPAPTVLGSAALTLQQSVPLLLAGVLAVVVGVAAGAPRLFSARHGRRHRLVGAVYLGWLALGLVGLLHQPLLPSLAWDVGLGVLGITLTLTAAADFPNKHARNVASGALDEDATVTQAEMVEHAFYQVGAVHMHACARVVCVFVCVWGGGAEGGMVLVTPVLNPCACPACPSRACMYVRV
jgi:hypothetical protein